VGECFFWYRPTRVVSDQRPLNGRCCCCCPGTASVCCVFVITRPVYAGSVYGHLVVIFLCRYQNWLKSQRRRETRYDLTKVGKVFFKLAPVVGRTRLTTVATFDRRLWSVYTALSLYPCVRHRCKTRVVRFYLFYFIL